MSKVKISVNSIEKTIAKLFILCFPLKMFAQASFLSDITFGLGATSSFLFCALGLFFIGVRRNIRFTRDTGTNVLKRFAVMYVICDFMSIIMAVILYSEVGSIAGETTLVAASKKILYSLAFIVIVFYCREIARVMSKEEMINTIDVCLNIYIVIGFIQVLVIYNAAGTARLYDGINSLFNAWSSSAIIQTKRIALLSKEPAYSAGFITTIAIPFLLSKLFSNDYNFKTIIKLILYIVLLYYTKSTTGYTVLLVVLGVFSVIYYLNSNRSSTNKLLYGALLISCALGITIFVAGNAMVSDSVSTVMDKLFSYDNPNSADRKGTIVVGLSILKRYPLFGVGDGNQGFFYQDFLPDWARLGFSGNNVYNRASNVLFDGGSFLISFISGYGLLGIVLLASFIWYSFETIRNNRESFGIFYYFYCISIPAFIVIGIGATLMSHYYFWFVLSLPMMISYWKKDEFVISE